jgi:hypothetical protein
MGIGWGLFILYLFFAGGFLTGLIATVSTFAGIPMSYLMKNNLVAKIINVIPFLLHGYASIVLPWQMDMGYGLLQYILAIVLSGTYLISFGTLIVWPFKMED